MDPYHHTPIQHVGGYDPLIKHGPNRKLFMGKSGTIICNFAELPLIQLHLPRNQLADRAADDIIPISVARDDIPTVDYLQWITLYLQY